MDGFSSYQHQCTLCTDVISVNRKAFEDQDNRCFNIYLVSHNRSRVITKYKTEIMGGPEFLHRNTGVGHFWT